MIENFKKFSIRGGYQSFGSPYKDSEIMEDYSTFSFGFGYDFGDTVLSISNKICFRFSPKPKK